MKTLFRVGAIDFSPDCSIQEVLNYEIQELGNKDLRVHQEVLDQVGQLPARCGMWACPEEKDAYPYLYDENDEVVSYFLASYIVIAEDSEGGVYVFIGVNRSLLL